MNSKFNVGDEVYSFFTSGNNVEIIHGYVVIVNNNGTFESSEISYDIEVTSESCPGLFKHCTKVFNTLEELVHSPLYIYTEYPFLKYDASNEWCYGNCDVDGWFSQVPNGWRDLFLQFMKELKPLLIKGECLDTFEIHQIKEKWGALRFYYGYVPELILDDVENLVRKYEKMSIDTCIDCGKKPTSYRTTGWITYLCSDCSKNYKFVEKLKK